MRASFLLGLGLVTAACDTKPEAQAGSAAVAAKLLQRDVEWADAATAGKDVDKIVSYWTDDAVLIESGMAPIEGKAAIRAFIARAIATPGFKIHWVSRDPVLSPDGRMGYLRMTTETIIPRAKGGSMTLHLQGYTIWRIDTDGEWRCVVDFTTEAPDPSPAPAPK